MTPPLQAYWNVGAGPRHAHSATEHGFLPVNLLNSFADYLGNQERNISAYLTRNKHPSNAWDRPPYFEEIVRRNIAPFSDRVDVDSDAHSIFVHDIEFDFQQEIAETWKDPDTRKASGKATQAAFEEAYLEQWKAKIPLRKRLQVGPSEWIVLAMTPWQAEDATSELEVNCGAQSYRLQLQGRHYDLFHIVDGQVQRHQVSY